MIAGDFLDSEKPRCGHGAALGERCASGCGLVGGHGPATIKAGQIWRTRSRPYGAVEVLEVLGDRVAFEHRGERQRWRSENFRDEFWYAGAGARGAR